MCAKQMVIGSLLLLAAVADCQGTRYARATGRGKMDDHRLVSSYGKLYFGSEVPDTTLTPQGPLKLLLVAQSKSEITKWTKSLPYVANCWESSKERAHHREAIVVAYISTSGLAAWNVHVFEKDPTPRWHCVLFVRGLLFKNPGIRVSGFRLGAANSVSLTDKSGAELVNYQLKPKGP